MATLKVPVTDQDHQTGNPNAKVVLVEYGDYQCSHCGIAYPLVKRLLQQFDGELLFVFRNFPLQESHPQAMIAALAAEAAGKQNKFWEMHDTIYEHQNDLSGNALFNYAASLHLDMERFARDWKSEDTLSKIESDFESGLRSGVNGTPSFFINGNRLDSYDESYESLAAAVRSLA